MEYFCARILIVCLVDDGRPRQRNTCDHQFVVIRARDFEHAFERALEFGRNEEGSYKNSKGQKVRWAFVCVEAIKRIGRKIDGCEVGSVLGDERFPEEVSFRQRFQPDKHQPYEA